MFFEKEMVGDLLEVQWEKAALFDFVDHPLNERLYLSLAFLVVAHWCV